MAQMTEQDQVAKRESLADLIAVAESDKTPYSSMLQKRKRPDQMDHSWQMKAYRVVGHGGVMDGKDATDFNFTPTERVHCYSQKSWDGVGVSDLAGESENAGKKGGEMASQVTDAIVVVKQIIERRCLSNNDTQKQAAPATPYETRGAFSWLSPNAQGTFPVPDQFRPGTDQLYSGTLAAFDENALMALGRAAYKKRKGPTTLDGFLGIDLKAKHSDFSRYSAEVSGKVSIGRFNQKADDKALINVIDRMVLDTGTIRLHANSFLHTDAATGEDTAFTHSSGVYIDMEMAALAYTRLPRVFPLQYAGGGNKKVVDTIFLHQLDNPVGMFSARINS